MRQPKQTVEMPVGEKGWKTIKPFPTVPADLGNRSNRFPHSHRHDDYYEMK
jgi:hypothetical protein